MCFLSFTDVVLCGFPTRYVSFSWRKARLSVHFFWFVKDRNSLDRRIKLKVWIGCLFRIAEDTSLLSTAAYNNPQLAWFVIHSQAAAVYNNPGLTWFVIHFKAVAVYNNLGPVWFFMHFQAVAVYNNPGPAWFFMHFQAAAVYNNPGACLIWYAFPAPRRV